ncbi:pentapeptide repeat-containing protein [Streptomyces angustmyceticus]|uniref:pentapeptide repeat-containing protein n=1 Tax=Streptomyces angustmyceticus TaxID=285578 RepID=UPI00381DC4F0
MQTALTALTRAESRTHVDPRETLDLHGLHLAGADLNHADLTHADLAGATLTKAHLIGATLTDAHLIGATLTDAHLIGATLTDANLRRVDLSSVGSFTLRQATSAMTDNSDAATPLCFGEAGPGLVMVGVRSARLVSPQNCRPSHAKCPSDSPPTRWRGQVAAPTC